AVTMRDQLHGLGIANVQLKNDTRNGNAVSRVLIGPFVDDELLAVVRKRLSDLQMPAVPVIE
ncbi:MAG: SPOR domain-containing protein, partial [Nevskiales bacterium]